MPVGRNGLQQLLVDDEQHSVEVVADVLLRHRELGELQQATEVALWQLDRLLPFLRQADSRIVRRGQRLQVEPRTAGPDRHFAR